MINCRFFVFVTNLPEIMNIVATGTPITGPQLHAILLKYLRIPMNSTERNNLHNIRQKLRKAKELVNFCKPFEDWIL